MAKFLLICYFILQSATEFQTQWGNCNTYRVEIERGSHSHFGSEVILSIIDKEMKSLKSLFDDELNAYLDAGQATEADDIHKWMLAAPELEPIKAEGLRRIKAITEHVVWNMTELFKVVHFQQLMDPLFELCDDTTGFLWHAIGDIDQKIKKLLVEKGLPVSNIIETKVEVSLPDDFEDQVIHAAVTAISAGEPNYDTLWHREAKRIAAEIMQKEAARVEAKLRSLQQHFLRRAKGAEENGMANIVLEKFKQIPEKFHHDTIKTIDSQLNTMPKFFGPRCSRMNTIDGIFDCARMITKYYVQNEIILRARQVLEFAWIVNYGLELEHL